MAAIAFTSFVLLGGCTLLSHEAPIEDIDKATALFFQRLDQEDYNGIYNDAASGLRQRKSRETVTDSLKELTAHGKVLNYQRIRFQTESEVKERIVSPVYGTTFEQVNGEVTLNFKDESGEWKLIGFAFRPRGARS